MRWPAPSPRAAVRIKTGAAVDTAADGVTVNSTAAPRTAGRLWWETFPHGPLPRWPVGPPAARAGGGRALAFRAMVLVYLAHVGGRCAAYDAHYLRHVAPVTRL